MDKISSWMDQKDRKYTPNDSRNYLAEATKVDKNNFETFFWIKEYEV